MLVRVLVRVVRGRMCMGVRMCDGDESGGDSGVAL